MARHHRDNHGRRAAAARPTLKARLNSNPSRLAGLERELHRQQGSTAAAADDECREDIPPAEEDGDE